MDIISVFFLVFFFFSFFFSLFFFLALKFTKRLKVSQVSLFKSVFRLLDRVMLDPTRIVLLSLYNNCYELSTRLDRKSRSRISRVSSSHLYCFAF